MKKINYLLIGSLFASLFILESCSKGDTGGGSGNPPPPPPPGQSLTVTPSKTTIFADGWEEISFVVKNQSNQDVTSVSQIYINNVLHTRTTFWTSTAGTYKIKATSNGITSPEVDVVASNPGASPFSQKILVEDYTGTWCGYCPRVGIKLETYTASHPNTIVIANHGPNASGPYGDPMYFPQHAALVNIYNQTGSYPTAYVDRDFKWNENNSVLDNQFTNRRPPLGVAFQTVISGSTINVTAKVKFDVNTNAEMKLIVYLVEDGLVYPQVNYGFNYNGSTANPLNNYVHNGTLRATGTNLFGDLIPQANQTKGTTYTQNLTFNAAGYNINKCRIIGFVVVGANNQNHKGVLNVQTVKAGESKDFD